MTISRAQVRRWAPVLLGLAALVLLGYGYAIAVPAVGVDDLAIDYYQSGGFLQQSRITVWLLQALTGLMTYQAHWPELFAAVCLGLAGLVFAGAVYDAAGRTPRPLGVLLLAGGLLLYPFHAELLAYSNQCGIGFAYLLAALALRLGLAHLLQGGGWKGAAGAVVCLTFAVGYYESMAQVWLTLFCIALLTRAAFAPRRTLGWRWVFPALLRGVWPLGAALVLRKVLSALLCALTGVSGSDGAAAKTIYWFRRENLGEALRIFLREFLDNYLALPFGVPALALLLTACCGLAVWALVRRHGNGCGLLTLALLATLFAMGLLQGTGSQMARASQCFAAFVPFVLWLLLQRSSRALWAAAGAALLAVECIGLNQTFLADRARWHYEEALVQRVAAQLNELDPDGALPVVFSGTIELPAEHTHPLPADSLAYKVQYLLSVTLGEPMGELYRYEEVNESVINWSQASFGTNDQMYILMAQQGRPCARGTKAQQTEGNVLADGLEQGTVMNCGDYLLVAF